MGERPEAVWPAASTMGDLLRAEGLVSARRRRRRVAAPGRPFRAVTAPNDVWCIDFKGWFRTRDGERCDPLTVSDAYSRFLLACVIVPPRTDTVRVAVEQLFKRYGLPLAIRSDNGAPFAGTGAGGLSRLSVGWIKAGIALERIEPGQPQQNGRHERMHRTLKAETAKPPAASAGQQQVRFDRFRQDFNDNRPHEALGQQPPAAFYRPSLRPYPERLDEPWYDAWHAMRRVRTDGSIKWGGDLVFISETLKGELVGIARPTAATGSFASPRSTSGSSIAGRKNFMASARPGRAARKPNKREHCYPCNRSCYLCFRLHKGAQVRSARLRAAPHGA